MYRVIVGALIAFDQKFQFEYSEISSGEWKNIFCNFSRPYNHIFENFSPRIPVPFDHDSPPRISKILSWMVLVWEIQQFRIFRKLSVQRCFCTIRTVSNLPEASVEWKAPKFSYRGLPFHFIFLPKFPKFWLEWFTFRQFNSFRIFWKLSVPGNFLAICSQVG